MDNPIIAVLGVFANRSSLLTDHKASICQHLVRSYRERCGQDWAIKPRLIVGEAILQGKEMHWANIWES
jgi:hypothetical protein